MNKILLAALLLFLTGAGNAFAQTHEGYLGDVSHKYMVQGTMYNFEILSYDFTPGINWTSPSGQQSHSIESAIVSPRHDGHGWVKSTNTNFVAQETGTYQVQIFSWDNQGAQLKYAMQIGEGPGSTTPPPPHPIIEDRGCPAGTCLDPHANPMTHPDGCVNINEPNYCDLNLR